MERRGTIMLGQRFGQIAWFSLAYGCNNNNKKKITAEMMESNRLLIPHAKLLNRGGWPRRRGADCFGAQSIVSLL